MRRSLCHQAAHCRLVVADLGGEVQQREGRLLQEGEDRLEGLGVGRVDLVLRAPATRGDCPYDLASLERRPHERFVAMRAEVVHGREALVRRVMTYVARGEKRLMTLTKGTMHTVAVAANGVELER